MVVSLTRMLNLERSMLDMVLRKEPPSPDSKLIQHENITGTLHLGASTMEAQTVQSVEIAEAIVRDSKGELSATAVNAPMVPPGRDMRSTRRRSVNAAVTQTPACSSGSFHFSGGGFPIGPGRDGGDNDKYKRTCVKAERGKLRRR
ncbi:hypothetical protein ACHQM5_029201 [Ranunculus cassubicifolius]